MIVGIDPGLDGALAFVDPADLRSTRTIALPVHTLTRGGKTKRELDAHGFADLLRTSPLLDHAFLEAAQVMPRQGLSSTAAFHRGYGMVVGVVAALGIPMTLVSPSQCARGASGERRRPRPCIAIAAVRSQSMETGKGGRKSRGRINRIVRTTSFIE